jgi:hypothetical protein
MTNQTRKKPSHSPTHAEILSRSLGDFNQLVVHDEQCCSSLLSVVCEMAAGSCKCSAQQWWRSAISPPERERERVPFASFFRRECRYCGTLNEDDGPNVTGEFTAADRRAGYRDQLTLNFTGLDHLPIIITVNKSGLQA